MKSQTYNNRVYDIFNIYHLICQFGEKGVFLQ